MCSVRCLMPSGLRHAFLVIGSFAIGVFLAGCGIGGTPAAPTTSGIGGNSVVVAVPLVIPPGQAASARINAACPGGKVVDQMTLLAWGGAPNSGYTWSVSPGSTFPPGTTVGPLSGIFQSTGNTPLIAGNYTVNMTVSDGSTTATGSFAVQVTTDSSGVCGSAVFEQSHLNTLQLPNAVNAQGYGASLYADGNGTLPWSWALAPKNGDGSASTLPGGMVIDQAFGVVRGTPVSSAAGQSFKFSVTVKDANNQTATCPCVTYILAVK